MTNNNEKCSYCEYNGIVYNSSYHLGEEPIQPCPRCIIPVCRCGGESPYYYMDNGKIMDCPCRNVRIRIQRIKQIYSNSGIEKEFLWKFLGDFKTTNKLANDAKTAAFSIVKDFPNVKKGLFLWGNTGTGKTMLSIIILTELICRNVIEGRYVKISRTFFNKLKESFNSSSDSYGQSAGIERELHEVDVLVLDDFGVQKNSSWEQETLYNLVDARYENQKFTVFTSNHNPLKAYGEISEGRVLSRLRGMCRIMELSGDDYRLKL